MILPGEPTGLNPVSALNISMMKKKILLALLTPALLWLAWPPMPFPITIFVAFVPLLLLEDHIAQSNMRKSGRKVFLWSYLSLALFNLATTWWIGYAHWFGVAATVFINGAMMAVPIWLYHLTRKVLPIKQGLILLPFAWIAYETIHKNWDLSWPWLYLGNAFARVPEWVQWYEHTGVFGGTLWVWVINIVLFLVARNWVNTTKPWLMLPRIAVVLVLASAPLIVYSYIVYNNYEEKGVATEVIVTQPNFDAYTEKHQVADRQQVGKMIALAKPLLTNNTRFLVGPEDMLGEGFQVPVREHIPALVVLQDYLREQKDLVAIAGATTFKLYKNESESKTARPLSNEDGYFDVFNSSFVISKNHLDFYNKSKLVAGVEQMPFERALKPLLGGLAQKMGGTVASMGYDKEPKTLDHHALKTKVAAPICYESVFGEHYAGFVRKGATLMFVITNDDWWGNTPGHIQHLHYARLRAIENRRAIGRSASTGISALINQRGDLIETLPYKTEGAIKADLYRNSELTYYTQSGDFIGRVSWFVAVLLLLSAFVKSRTKREA